MTRQTFSPDFKREAVRLMEEPNTDAAQLARKLGIRRNQLYKWQKEIDSYGEEAFPGHGNRPTKGQSLDETQALKAKINK